MKLKIITILLLLICSGTASAWLSGYDHRMVITVNNGGASTLNYYQFNFTNDTNVLFAAGQMQASGADCRVADASDNLIPFWNESPFNATNTKIYANATALTVGDNTFYMYYGNSGASDVSDGDTTFDDFIDNEGSTYSFVKNSSNPIIDRGGVGAWDEKTIYVGLLPQYINSSIKMVGGEYYAFYTGGGDTAHPNHEISVGLATGTAYDDLTKYASNPILNRSDIGLGGTGQGVAAFDIKDIDGTTYMFAMCMYSNTDFRITMFEADDTTLLNWSNMTDVLTTNYKDHCPWVIEDPDDANKLIMYYAYIVTSGGNYQIGRATANKADPWTWTYDTVNNPILAVTGKNVLYPFVKYENGAYYMHYIKNPSSTTYKIYTTSNASDSGFSDTDNITIDLGPSGVWDDGYVSTPREYNTSGDVWMYFTGRKAGSNYYTGMGVADWTGAVGGGSLVEWDVTGGSVSATTDRLHRGTSGIKYKTSGASPYPEVQKNCVGKNKIYETWIYDDMSTTANFMNTVRLYDTSGADPLMGIWITTSSTHYSYRAEGGSYTASSVSRSNGWHKIQFDVAASSTKAYIDGTLIFTEPGLDEDNLDYFRVMGYIGGTGYSDTYVVRQYTATEPIVSVAPDDEQTIYTNISLHSKYPETLFTNYTGLLSSSYIVNSSHPLNFSSLAFLMGMNYTLTDDYHSYLKVPPNTIADGIYRAHNRNVSPLMAWESNSSITEGNVWKWGGGDNSDHWITNQSINSTHTWINITGYASNIFPSMFYLGRKASYESEKTPIEINKGQGVIFKIWDLEQFRGRNHDYYLSLYFDSQIETTPNDNIEIWYCNDSFNPLTDDPCLICDYKDTWTGDRWIDHESWQPHNNVSFAKPLQIHAGTETCPSSPTEINYIYLKSDTSSSKSYILNATNSDPGICNLTYAETETMWLRDEVGGSNTPIAATPSFYNSFLRDYLEFTHHLYIANDQGLWGHSDYITHEIGISDIPPTHSKYNYFWWNDTVCYNMTGAYTESFWINLTYGFDPDNGAALTHVLSLYDDDYNFVAFINDTLAGNQTDDDVWFDIEEYKSNTPYTFKLVSTDNEGSTSVSWSPIFSLPRDNQFKNSILIIAGFPAVLSSLLETFLSYLPLLVGILISGFLIIISVGVFGKLKRW